MAKYISKDFIHFGCGLITDPAKVIEAVPYSVRKNIKKAEKSGITARRVEGTSGHISILKGMWYDPGDPNIPAALSESEYMFMAFVEEEPIGVCILLPVGKHLFLNNLAGNEKGKELRVQDYLLWHCVNYFSGSGFDYIDVGVSYRPTLYRFFKKWQTFSYPVIFNKPEINFPISMNPFVPEHFHSGPDVYKEAETLVLIEKLTGISQFTFAPNYESVDKICAELGLDAKDETFNFPEINPDEISYISLPNIFTCQFGALIFNLKIDDKEMWDKYQCLDIFKRQLTYSIINDELKIFEDMVEKRKSNYTYLEKLFGIDDIKAIDNKENIPSLFCFFHNEHKRYHNKLDEFEIEHNYDSMTGEIGLPVHQNLKKDHLDYIYGIFRGVLNLCSEWVHTDRYDKYKE